MQNPSTTQSALHPPTSTLHRTSNIAPTIRQRTHHLACKHIAEFSIRLSAPLELLIEPLHKLDELAGVDIRIPRAFDVLDDFWWQADG